MKKLVGIIILISFKCLADGYAGADGSNSLGEILHIGYESDDYVLYVQKNQKDRKWSERYNLREECPDFNTVVGTIFTCTENRKFPLAGAKFKVVIDPKIELCDDPGSHPITYRCIEGCNRPRVPKIFDQQQWEGCGA